LEIQRYINQLSNDKYIMQDHDYHWMIRIEGLLFEGYQQKIVNRDAENVRLDIAIAYQREQADTLNRLTRWVAAGAIIAAGYYLYYLIIPIYDHFFAAK
jgi:hypothetical protein